MCQICRSLLISCATYFNVMFSARLTIEVTRSHIFYCRYMIRPFLRTFKIHKSNCEFILSLTISVTWGNIKISKSIKNLRHKSAIRNRGKSIKRFQYFESHFASFNNSTQLIQFIFLISSSLFCMPTCTKWN